MQSTSPTMSSAPAKPPSVSQWKGGAPGSRFWRRKLPLLTIVGLLMVQILLYCNDRSLHDAHRFSVPPNLPLQLRWLSDNATTKSSVYSISLSGSGGGNSSTHHDSTRLCPPYPPSLKGQVQVNRNPPSLAEQERAHPELTLGGYYRPENCTARHKVAIIVPYRNRASHLTALVHHMHTFLQRQQLEYAIYVVEQAGDNMFNRGMLMNVGVLEALKQHAFDCLVLHDVDLMPEDDRNLYSCLEPPRHMSVAMSTYAYRIPYQTYFGGVSAMTAEQFTTINGFSNKFWGWGGEDDDFFNRVRHHGLNVSRYPSEIARYTMLSHKKEKPSPDRFINVRLGKWRFKKDGLNSVKYQILKTERRRLFTLLFVALERT